MAKTSNSVPSSLIGSRTLEHPRTNRSVAPFCARAFSNGCASPSASARSVNNAPSALAEGPSCIFVGRLETASKETLEALYLQARDAYYSGRPLIVDDMFDRVELQLRLYGSKSVFKYPRCSIRRQSTYADAEEDPSQVLALASIWTLFLAFGSSACLVPVIYATLQAYQNVYNSGLSYTSPASEFEFLGMVNAVLFMALGSAIGYPTATASVNVLQGLWKNDLVALRGACPNCGEEVFAFVRSDQTRNSPHRADCHVCQSCLEFQIKVEQSISRLGRNCVHGRIYLISQRGRRHIARWA